MSADPTDRTPAHRWTALRKLLASRGRHGRAALGFIFVTVVIDVIALGIIVPVLPTLIESLTGGDAAAAAGWVGWFGLLWAAMQFIFSPILGALSDRFGRRPVILGSIFGLGFDYVVMALAPNVTWLLVGRIVSGITTANLSTANAYISDVTPPESRAQSFGLIGAAFGLGFVIGPALGGILGLVSPRLPFWVAGALCLLNGLYGVFVLPESLDPRHRSPFSLRNASPIGSFKLLAEQPVLLGLGSVVFLFFLAHQVLQSTFVLYTTYRYGWDTLAVGLNMMAVGIGSIIVQTRAVRPCIARFGERGTLYAGLVFSALGFLVFGIASTGLVFWLGVPLFSLRGLVQPGLMGLMSRRIDASRQGQLQGANSSLMAIGGMIGPILFTQIFAFSIKGLPTSQMPGLASDIAAAMMVIALLVAVWSLRRVADLPPAKKIG